MKTAQELFDVKIPNLFQDHPEKVKRIGMVFLFKITGPGGGTWTVDLASPSPSCTPGASGQQRCTVEISFNDLKNVLLQPQLAVQLYFQGKVKIQGDPMMLAKLQPLFALIA